MTITLFFFFLLLKEEIAIIFIKWEKNTTLSSQFENPIKKIEEIGKIYIGYRQIHLYMIAHFPWLIHTPSKNGGVTLVVKPKTYPPNEMIPPWQCFSHVRSCQRSHTQLIYQRCFEKRSNLNFAHNIFNKNVYLE